MTTTQIEEQALSIVAERRAKWGIVLKGATLYTAMAVQAHDWAKVRHGEEMMATASGRAGLDSAFLTAIFGGQVPDVDLSNRFLVAIFEAGKSAGDAQVAQAREVVRANKAAREAAAQTRHDAECAQRAEQARKEKAIKTEDRKAEAKSAGLTVGALVQVTWTYKQAKRDVATTEGGDIVECFGNFAAGSGQARVKKVGGRLPVVELV